jgi:TonB family protein
MMWRIKIMMLSVVCCGMMWPSSAIGQSVERPVPISATIPAYPAMARAKRISGVVLVDVQVNAEGNVSEAKPLMGGEYLREAAMKAALSWRFKPLQSGIAYSVRLTFIFHEFSYKPPEKKPDFRSPYQIEIPYPEGTGDCFNDCP